MSRALVADRTSMADVPPTLPVRTSVAPTERLALAGSAPSDDRGPTRSHRPQRRDPGRRRGTRADLDRRRGTRARPTGPGAAVPTRSRRPRPPPEFLRVRRRSRSCARSTGSTGPSADDAPTRRTGGRRGRRADHRGRGVWRLRPGCDPGRGPDAARRGAARAPGRRRRRSRTRRALPSTIWRRRSPGSGTMAG